MTIHHSTTSVFELGLRTPTVQELLLEITGLQEALMHRDVIGQAKGIIRLLTRCDDDDAFDLLRWISQDTNRKVREVAELIATCSATGDALPPDVSSGWHSRTR